MSKIPTDYQTTGYGTIFGDSEARQAIANAEVTNKIGTGGGGGGGTSDASADNQEEQIALETEIRDRLPSSLGAKTAANSLAVTLSSDGAFSTSFGAQADSAATTDTGTFSFISLFKRSLQRLTSIIGQLPSALISDRLKIDLGANGTQGTIKASSTQSAITDTALVTTDRDLNSIVLPFTGTSGTLWEGVVTGYTWFALRIAGSYSITTQGGEDSGSLTNVIIEPLNTTNSSAFANNFSSGSGNCFGGKIHYQYLRITGTAGAGSTITLFKSSPPDFNIRAQIINTVNSTSVGTIPHDSALTSIPVAVGGWARSTWSTPVQDIDATRFIGDLLGRQINLPFAPPELTLQSVTPVITGTSNTQLFAANATHKNNLTSMVVGNESNTSTWVIIKDGTTEIGRVFVPALDSENFTFNPPLRGSLNTAINVANLTTGSGTSATATGFITTI